MAFSMIRDRLLSLWSTLKNWAAALSRRHSPLTTLLSNWLTWGVKSGNQPDSNDNDVIEIERDAKGAFICGGLTGIVELLDDGTVIKSPFPGPMMEDHVQDIAKEAVIYRRIGFHERLVRLVSHSSDGIILEYMPNGDLKRYLQSHESSSIPTSLKLTWAYQVSEAVQLLHDNSILHCDIKPRNLLLDNELNIKIIDFSGSSLDGSKPTSGEGTRFYLPRDWRDPPTIATDLFALGSTLYEIFQGNSPFEELPSDEVTMRYTALQFPNVSDIPCGQVIEQCWLSKIKSAREVHTAIGKIINNR
ncbi:receptor-interacting serine/threonine-protein kinase [Trichophyton mentagrophytes]|nr:receptor-interacting serine/threonine-protein kinase [Trichophyton mentagrophytes]